MGELLEKERISYILDTSGCVPLSEDVKEVFRRSESVLLDLKFWDEDSYLRYTGKGIENTLKTLSYLDSISKKTVIRTVVIPGINDTLSAMERYLSCLKGFSCISDYELLPFHTMGFFKYESLGIENPFFDKKALDPDVLSPLQKFVRERFQ
jgi:pyruvate formate lyase activating enzyme